MRDIRDLLEREKPAEKLTPEEIALILEDDMKMIKEFGRDEPFRKEDIGRRPWR